MRLLDTSFAACFWIFQVEPIPVCLLCEFLEFLKVLERGRVESGGRRVAVHECPTSWWKGKEKRETKTAA
jgi:hypothetical protein